MRDTPVVIQTTSYEEFRDNIHQTQLFDMLDCTVEIDASPIGSVEDLDRIISLIESMINVVDVRVTSHVDSEDFVITLTPVVMTPNKRPRK